VPGGLGDELAAEGTLRVVCEVVGDAACGVGAMDGVPGDFGGDSSSES
jgi:hypothetical protein